MVYKIRRGNYFGGEPIGRAEVEVRLGKLKNGKAAGKDEITEMIKGGGEEVTGWWIIIITWRVSRSKQHSKRDITAEEKATLKFRHKT